MTTTDWDERFRRLAAEVATWSKDTKRKVGAVVVSADRQGIAVGYNGFPPGIDDDHRLDDPETKNLLTIHAERNALDNALFDVKGATMYVTKFPCHECAKGLISHGIIRVVAPEPDLDHPTWGKSHELAIQLLSEAWGRWDVLY